MISGACGGGGLYFGVFFIYSAFKSQGSRKILNKTSGSILVVCEGKGVEASLNIHLFLSHLATFKVLPYQKVLQMLY